MSLALLAGASGAAHADAPEACPQAAGRTSAQQSEAEVWSHYWRGPAAGVRRVPLEAFPILCAVSRASGDEGARRAALSMLNGIGLCTKVGTVSTSTGEIVQGCGEWKLQPVAGNFERYVESVERIARDGRPGGAACAVLSTSAALDVLTKRQGTEALVARLAQAGKCGARGVGDAGLVGPPTRTFSGSHEGHITTQNDALDEQLRIEAPRSARELALREGDRHQDSPDDQAMLRRQAKSYLAQHEAGKAVAALTRALGILELAFGRNDKEYLATAAELARAKAIAASQARPFPPACAVQLGARPLGEQPLLAELRQAYQLVRSQLPVPPLSYGAACRALSGDSAFAQEQWSDPVVTGPLLAAAKTSVGLIPREAAQLHVDLLVARAAELGLGSAPEFASTCPAALLDLAGTLVKRHGLPPQPKIKAVTERLSRARACARSQPAQAQPAPSRPKAPKPQGVGKAPKQSPP